MLTGNGHAVAQTVRHDATYAAHVNAQWVRLLDLLEMNVRYTRCSGEVLAIEDLDRLAAFITTTLDVAVDASLLRRGLANLLDNELTHTRTGASIVVTLTADEREVSLRIEDNGHGLGLPFARAIAVAHGGRLTAGNRPEGGAFVTFTLPRVAGARLAPA